MQSINGKIFQFKCHILILNHKTKWITENCDHFKEEWTYRLELKKKKKKKKQAMLTKHQVSHEKRVLLHANS